MNLPTWLPLWLWMPLDKLLSKRGRSYFLHGRIVPRDYYHTALKLNGIDPRKAANLRFAKESKA